MSFIITIFIVKRNWKHRIKIAPLEFGADRNFSEAEDFNIDNMVVSYQTKT